MNYLTLEMLKQQCNIDPWFEGDDNYLTLLGDAAEQAVENQLDKSLDDITMERGGILPAPLIQAMLLSVAHWYMNRESVTYSNAAKLPMGYDFLVAPYKNFDNSQI